MFDVWMKPKMLMTPVDELMIAIQITIFVFIVIGIVFFINKKIK